MYKVKQVDGYNLIEPLCNRMYAEGYVLDQFQHKGSGIYVLIFKLLTEK